MEAGDHGDPGETAQGHVVVECSTPLESVITQFQRMEESTVKANGCNTDRVILRTVQIIMVSWELIFDMEEGDVGGRRDGGGGARQLKMKI